MRFVEPTQRKAEGAKNETQILIRRQFNGRNVSYRVIENPLRLGSDEWDRVVAVFVMVRPPNFSQPLAGTPVAVQRLEMEW